MLISATLRYNACVSICSAFGLINQTKSCGPVNDDSINYCLIITVYIDINDFLSDIQLLTGIAGLSWIKRGNSHSGGCVTIGCVKSHRFVILLYVPQSVARSVGYVPLST